MLLVPVNLILLFPLIVVSFSSSVFLFRCVLHPLPLSSCLGCIPPLIGLPSLRFYAVGSSLFLLSVCFCLCFLFYREDALCWLLPCQSFSVCFPCLSLIPSLIWFGSVYLVTTAGFVADQLMRENNNNNSTLLMLHRQAFAYVKRTDCYFVVVKKTCDQFTRRIIVQTVVLAAKVTASQARAVGDRGW